MGLWFWRHFPLQGLDIGNCSKEWIARKNNTLSTVNNIDPPSSFHVLNIFEFFLHLLICSSLSWSWALAPISRRIILRIASMSAQYELWSEWHCFCTGIPYQHPAITMSVHANAILLSDSPPPMLYHRNAVVDGDNDRESDDDDDFKDASSGLLTPAC